MSHTIDGNQIDTDDPLAVAVIAGGSTAHTIDGNLIDEDHPLAVAVVSGGGGSMTAPEIAAAGGMAVVAYKSVDEAVNNSDVLQDDDALFFAVGVNEVWSVRTVLKVLADVPAGIQTKWSGPVGADLAWAVEAGTPDAWSVPSNGDAMFGNTNPSSTFATLAQVIKQEDNFGSASPGGLVVLGGIYTGGANAGTLQLQWAQFSASVGDTKVLAGSHILACRLA